MINILNMNKKNTNNCGMTFIEMIVYLSIFSIIIMAITYSVASFYRYNAYGLEQSQAVDSARRGIDPTINNIREATYSDEGAYPIISASANSFSFYSDVDRDNSIEKVRLFLDSSTNTFKKGLTDSAGDPPTYDSQPETLFTLADNVRNIEQSVDIFKYYDNTGAEVLNLSNVSSIAFVSMSVVVNVNPARAPNDFTLRASAALRNLKSNL
jgi:type II secretory pathway pseudopilin PulG